MSTIPRMRYSIARVLFHACSIVLHEYYNKLVNGGFKIQFHLWYEMMSIIIIIIIILLPQKHDCKTRKDT